MALSQTQSDERGASTVYHRVAKADLDYTSGEATITIHSYADGALRQAEIDDVNSKYEYETLMNELNTLTQNPTEENEARRIELSEQLNELTPINEVRPRHLTEEVHTLSTERDSPFTLTDAYDWLKTNVFESAVDV